MLKQIGVTERAEELEMRGISCAVQTWQVSVVPNRSFDVHFETDRGH